MISYNTRIVSQGTKVITTGRVGPCLDHTKTLSPNHMSRLRQRIRPLSSAAATKQTTVIALSGGVDSSVAACQLLQLQHCGDDDSSHHYPSKSGCTFHAIHMSNWNTRDDVSLESTTTCSSDADWKDAQAVAKHLQLSRIQRLSFEREYWIHVWEPFVSRLSASASTRATAETRRTALDASESDKTAVGSFNNAFVMGNPDIDCNKYVKFGALQDWCRKHFGDDAYQLATGHYARLYHADNGNDEVSGPPVDVEETLQENSWLLDGNAGMLLLAAIDASKDQSYFLAACSATSLRNVTFPLGDLHKNHGPHSVRALAQHYQLPTAAKRDSMGICFVGTRQRGFRQFLQDYLPVPATEQVEFVDIESGAVVGATSEADFACLWTIGQGAKIGGSAERYFVAGHDMSDRNTVLVCAGTNHSALYSESLAIEAVHWVAEQVPAPLLATGSMRVMCRIRHLQPLAHATLVQNHKDDKLTVVFDEPVRGVTKGQFAAFYIGAVCLGGGPIAQVGVTLYETGQGPDDAVASH